MPLVDRFAPYIVALLKSMIQITGKFSPPSILESPQRHPAELISLTVAWIQSMVEDFSQDVAQDDGVSRLECLIEIFAAYGCFWEDVQNPENANEEVVKCVIENYEQALAIAERIKPSTEGRGLVSKTYTKYWSTLERRFLKTQKREAAEATMRALRRSGQFTLSEEAIKLRNVARANILWSIWRWTPGAQVLLEEAMDSSREAIRVNLKNQTEAGEYLGRYATMQNNLLDASQTFASWFDNEEVFSDLDAAVKAAKLAYQSLLPGSPRNLQEKATIQFGSVLRTRYDWAGSVDDLKQALATARSVLTSPPRTQPELVFSWTRCAMRFMDFSSYFDLEDCLEEAQLFLNRSLNYYEDIVENPTQWVPCEKAICLRFMSQIYQTRWRRRFMIHGSRDTLDFAVDCADKAVTILHDEDPLLSEGVDNRTLVYYARYLSPFAEPCDLDTAIASATRGISLGAHNYSNMQRAPRVAERMTVVSIGIAGDILAARYLRDGHLSDLDAAIHAVELLLKLLPQMHQKRAHALQNYRDRLEMKLKYYLKRSDRSREDNLRRRWLFKISRSSNSRFNSVAENDLNLLRDLLRWGRGRSKHLPLDAIRRPKTLAIMLGNELLYEDFSPIVYPRGSYLEDLRLSIDKTDICTQGSARPLHEKGLPEIDNILRDMPDLERLSSDLDTPVKLERIMSLGEWMLEHGQRKGLEVIWRYAFAILDSLNLHTMRTKEYRSSFRRLAVLAVMVASSMLTQGAEIWSIISVLERGREVLNSLSFLSTQAPRIKYAFNLERQVEEIVADFKNPGLERNHEWRRSQFRHLEAFECNSRDMLKAVQDLINCEAHMAPFGKEQIIQQSQGGPIVMLVASSVGSHAIIITPFKSRAITLDACIYQDALKKSAETRLVLKECEQDHGRVGDANQKLRQLLKWLWDKVVNPVVKDLGLSPQLSVEKLPRIQWVCCGVFSRLPIHAAGNFTRPGKPHLAQYAVSSYLSSVRYTVMAKHKDPYLRPTQSQIIIVTMPHTDADASARYGDLDTEAESLAISRNLPKSLSTTYLTNPEMGTIQSLIRGCRVAHFSCHGVIDAADPLRSRLTIRFDAHQALTVAAIRDPSSSFSRLAFLSACHSANFEDESTADEVVHVAKAFQLAGFPSVVGTLWQAFDGDAAIVSGEFYAYLKRRMDQGAVSDFDGDLFARALHSAVNCLREKNPYSCVNWASWIHYGD